jgi:anthranilate 1,2-dioxygenase small subunit
MAHFTDFETEFRIARLIDDYGRYLDHGDFGKWIDLFEGEDASYMIHPRENAEAGLEGYWMYCRDKPMIRDRILALKNANIYNIHYDRHLISGVRIEGSSSGVYDVRANYCVIQTDVEGRSEVFSAGEYRDKISVSDGNPRFRAKVVVPDTFNIQRPLAVPL